MKNRVKGGEVVLIWMRLVAITFTIAVVIIAAMVILQLVIALFKAQWMLVGLLVVTIVGITYKKEVTGDK